MTATLTPRDVAALPAAPPAAPESSIIIRAYNEERWLPEVFAALARQRYRDFEVLVVDSGSTDRTREIAAAHGARIVTLRKEDFTFGHSLNVGIEAARGALLALLSAHAIPADDGWLEQLVAPLRQADVAMVYGGQRGHAVSKFPEVQDFARLFPDEGEVTFGEDPFANNANSAIRRDLWLEHPFDEGLPGLEDIAWAKYWTEAGKRVVYVAEAPIIHVHEESWAQVRNRYHREGMAARWVGAKYLRHIPAELWREAAWCVQDLRRAAGRGALWRLGGEILRFRYEKTWGTVKGIIDSRGRANPARRASLFRRRHFEALVIRGANRAQLEARELPPLRPGELLVRVSHAGVCGTDLEILEGTLGYYRTGQASYPIVPGHESAGTVVTAGPRVTGLAEGDRVVVECIQGCGECAACAADDAVRCAGRREVGVMGIDGACATYLVTRARYAHRVPEGLSLAQAALAEPLAVVLKGLRRLGSAPEGDRPRRVAVIGAGTIGHFAAQVLRLRGHQVTVVDRLAERLALLGPGVATATSLEGVGGCDWIVEATGKVAVLETLLRESATGASLLLLGLPYGDQRLSFEQVVAYDKTVVGSVGSSGADFREALATLPRLDTGPFLTATYPLAEFERAWAHARSGSALKVMLEVAPRVQAEAGAPH